jgi:4-hydroxy-2-oxoheptanedioate aldolase
VRRFLDYGYTWVAVGSDMSMMVGRAGEWLGELRNAPSRSAPSAGPY